MTFGDFQLWDGPGECAVNATFGDIDVTFSAISGTFCETAPARDGVKAENTETTGRKPVFPTEGPLVDLSDEATPGVVKTPSKLAHTPLDTPFAGMTVVKRSHRGRIARIFYPVKDRARSKIESW